MTRKLLLIFFIISTLTSATIAQQVRTFEDTYGIKGTYTYSGNFSDSMLPQQGPVDIKWREIQGRGITTYRIKGRTAKHLPEGSWIWEQAGWGYNVTVGTGIQPMFNAMGKRMKWEGGFKNGVPDGKWTFTLDSITPANNVQKKLARIEITYKQGIPAGPMLYENFQTHRYLRVQGTADGKGIATGTWYYTYAGSDGRTVKEERQYKNGLLTDITTRRGDDRLATVSLERNKQYAGHIADTGIGIGPLTFDSDDQPTMQTLQLDQELHTYFLNGWTLDIFPYTFTRQLPVYKKLEYPLSATERTQILTSRNLIAQQQSAIREHLSGNINIHRSRSGTLDTTIAYLQLQLQRIQYIDSLLLRTTDPLFTYKNRYDQGLEHWLRGLNTMRTTHGEVYDSLVIQLPAFTIADRYHTFREIQLLLEGDDRKLPAYFDIVNADRLALNREGTLKKLEDTLSSRLQLLQDIYAGTTGTGGEIYQKWIKGSIQELLQQYAQSDDYDSALHIGQTLMARMDSLEAWAPQFRTFDSMPQLLRQQYTYLAYNPYTGINDIEIMHKRRFISNILVNMWPHMEQEMHQEQDWNKWSAMWNRRFRIYHYLGTFVSQEDKHAKKLEQRIRGERKPDKMVRHLLQQSSGH